MPRVTGIGSRFSLLWLLSASAAAFHVPGSSLNNLMVHEPASMHLRAWKQALRAYQPRRNTGPVYREALTPHVSIERLPFKAPVDDVLRMLGNPKVEKMYVTPPKKFSNNFHGGQIYLTCADLQEAEKLLNTPAAVLRMPERIIPTIRRLHCAYDETRVVRVSGFDLNCNEETLTQLASVYGPVSRVVMFYERPHPPPHGAYIRPAPFARHALITAVTGTALIVFENPESAKAMKDAHPIPFRRVSLNVNLVCKDHYFRPHQTTDHPSQQVDDFRISLVNIPTSWTEKEVVDCLEKYDIPAKDVSIGIRCLTLNNTLINSGKATAGVHSFKDIMKAVFMVNVKSDGCFASGIPPPDGNIIPYVIHNVPSEDVISREAWMDHFFQSGIDTVFRTAFVHDETGHHFTFDMATLRDAVNLSALNGTVLGNFTLNIQRQYVVQRSRFYIAARNKFCKVFDIGPFEYERFLYLFPDEAGLASGIPSKEAAQYEHDGNGNMQGIQGRAPGGQRGAYHSVD